MKLVNPAGRNIETFNTEAYKRCVCSINFDHAVALNAFTPCGCECSYGTENRNANRNLSGN